ncbi:hypothetical protein CPAR01_00966 [Colletotrichum paranaense]|uniref:Major facilitator superfamily transporter n=1 Tax=Colletotrichum paranaense TaxID=1914294 RepID=A0ABQ9T670_9PEZI|nr:uncharacterized protein CPAR01_00966 [Colletotrichum paranaense]KAK1546999.1 hypothetical protein CPAR01_00966 [Colletotrichum paranaense]
MGFAESSNGDIHLLHMYGVERSGTMVSSRTLYFLLSPVIGVLIDSFQSGNGWRAAQGAIPVSVYALTRSKKSLPYNKIVQDLVYPIRHRRRPVAIQLRPFSYRACKAPKASPTRETRPMFLAPSRPQILWL